MIPINKALIVNKVIYAKRHPTTAQQIDAVLLLQIETHLVIHANLKFKGVGKVVANNDRSQTYPLYFEEKILADEIVADTTRN
jgi:hypothetical protein